MNNLEFLQVELRELAEVGSHQTLEQKAVRLLRSNFPIDPEVAAALKQWAQSLLAGLDIEPIEEVKAFVVPGTGAYTMHQMIGPNRRLAMVLQTTISEIDLAEQRRARGR